MGGPVPGELGVECGSVDCLFEIGGCTHAGRALLSFSTTTACLPQFGF